MGAIFGLFFPSGNPLHLLHPLHPLHTPLGTTVDSLAFDRAIDSNRGEEALAPVDSLEAGISLLGDQSRVMT